MSLRLGVLDVECLCLTESFIMLGKMRCLIFSMNIMNKYITSPCAPPIYPLHPTPNESLDIIHNLRIINLIIRGLPRNLIVCLPTLECAYTIWRYLEEHFPNYSLKNLDEILQKSIAFHKMKLSDPKFDECLFELLDLMRAKKMLESLVASFQRQLEFTNLHIVMMIYLMNHLI